MIWLLFALNIVTLCGARLLTMENEKLYEKNKKLQIDNDLKYSKILDLEESNRKLIELNYNLTQNNKK